MVVAAAQTCDYNSNIIFRVGYLGTTILWREVDLEVSKDMSGSSPVVTINKHNCIISVYFSTTFRKLLMKFGTVNVDSKNIIEWSEQGPPLDYGSGMYPSVTLSSDGQVVRMHETKFGGNDLFYEVGNLT